MNPNPADPSKTEIKVQHRKLASLLQWQGDKHEHRSQMRLLHHSQHQAVSIHLPQTWKAEQITVISLTFHPGCATDLHADVLLVEVQNTQTSAVNSHIKNVQF